MGILQQLTSALESSSASAFYSESEMVTRQRTALFVGSSEGTAVLYTLSQGKGADATIVRIPFQRVTQDGSLNDVYKIALKLQSIEYCEKPSYKGSPAKTAAKLSFSAGTEEYSLNFNLGTLLAESLLVPLAVVCDFDNALDKSIVLGFSAGTEENVYFGRVAYDGSQVKTQDHARNSVRPLDTAQHLTLVDLINDTLNGIATFEYTPEIEVAV